MSPKSDPAKEHHRNKVVFRTATPIGVAPLLVGQVGARTGIVTLPGDPHPPSRPRSWAPRHCCGDSAADGELLLARPALPLPRS